MLAFVTDSVYRTAKNRLRRSEVALALLHPPYMALKNRLKAFVRQTHYGSRLCQSDDAVSQHIADLIQSGVPAAIGKIGSLEGEALHHVWRTRESGAIAFPRILARQLHYNVGVFPPTDDAFARFCETYAEALGALDVLGVWGNVGEPGIVERHCPEARLVLLTVLQPYLLDRPWTAALAGKRVLVIHPFCDSIASQYSRRDLIWRDDRSVLPEFTLETLQMPLSAALVSQGHGHASWAALLSHLQRAMARIPFDVALIGAGGMSLPLAAHAKRLGRIGVHLGGATQVLFGIRGRRFDADPAITRFYNPHWVRPLASETPAQRHEIENGCYW